MKLNPIFKYQKFSVILKSILFLLLVNLCITAGFAQNKKDFIVVLDAGHGGKDPGKIGYKGAKEKDVALSIVLKAGEELEKIQGVKVLYTRKTDVFVNLWKRGDFANERDADLFVSVHCNAHTSQAIGSETWVLGLHANERNFRVAKAENEVILQEENHEERYQGFDPKSPTSVIGLSLEQEEYLDQSLLLASLIQEEFEKKLHRVNRGVKQAGFVVLYQTYMPSVLIETGFLTNRIEGKYLYSKAGQQQMSKAIAKSILDYYEQQKLNVATNDVLDIVTPVVEKEPINLNTFYKVQIASSKKKMRTASYNFKGFKNVERVKVGAYYKYYLGKFSDKNEAEIYLKKAKSKGYKSAFVVAFDTEAEKIEIPAELGEKSKETTSKNSVVYKVQLASSSKHIETKAPNFKGLLEVHAVKVGNYYKYYLGNTNQYEKAKAYLKKARVKNYNSAFIVAFLNNKRIPLKEAIKIERN